MKQIKKNSSTLIFKTKMKEVDSNPDKSITFTNGLIGLPQLTDFILTELPIKHSFKLLQSLDKAKTNFVVLPAVKTENDLFNEVIEESHIIHACADLNISYKHLVLLFIINIRDIENKPVLYANFRAPIFIDYVNLLGYQYVLAQEKYLVCQKI